MKQRIRIDALLVERGLAPSREKAQAMILAGEVLAGEQKITKSGLQGFPRNGPPIAYQKNAVREPRR